MKRIARFIPAITAFAPMVAMAATFGGIINTISNIISAIVPLLIAIALVVFIWGVIKYITAGDDAEKRSAARNTIIYGIIGLFAIVAVWGLVNVIADTFGIQTGGTINRPFLPH